MKFYVTAVVALVLVGLSGTARAQTRLTISDGHEEESLIAQGWTQAEEGVWRRTAPDGRKETFVSGAAGLAKVLPALREQQARLMEAFLAHPTKGAKRALDEQSQLVDAVAANVTAGRANKAASTAGCTRTFSYGADVRSFHCGDVADSSASYSTSNATSCPEQCTVHSYSYISSTCNGVLTEDTDTCTQTGTNVSCSSWASGGYTVGCYDYAYASIHCPQLSDLYLSQSDYTTACWCPCY